MKLTTLLPTILVALSVAALPIAQEENGLQARDDSGSQNAAPVLESPTTSSAIPSESTETETETESASDSALSQSVDTAVPLINVQALGSATTLQFSKDKFQLKKILKEKSEGELDDEDLENLAFPGFNGSLKVKGANGKIMGTLSADSDGNLSFNFDLQWINKPKQPKAPKIKGTQKLTDATKTNTNPKTSPKKPNSGNKGLLYGGVTSVPSNVASKANPLAKPAGKKSPAPPSKPKFSFKPFGGRGRRGRRDEESSVDDSIEELYIPVYVEGPGITFESLLLLSDVTFDSEGYFYEIRGTDLFIDDDGYIDFEDCEMCNFPTS